MSRAPWRKCIVCGAMFQLPRRKTCSDACAAAACERKPGEQKQVIRAKAAGGWGSASGHMMRLTDERIKANIERVYQAALAAGTVGNVNLKHRGELHAEKVG